MKTVNVALAAALGMMTVAGTAAPVSARGLIAGALKDIGVINEDQRRALDKVHEDGGKPLDRAAADAAGAAADTILPGSGRLLRQRMLDHAFPYRMIQ